MKQLLCIISFLCILLSFVSCQSDDPLSASYDGCVTILSGDSRCEAKITADGSTLTAEMTSPPSVSGISYHFSSGKLTTALNGLECITDASQAASSPIGALALVLTDLSHTKRVSSEGGVQFYEYDLPNGTAQITAQDGRLLRVKMPDGTQIIFS